MLNIVEFLISLTIGCQGPYLMITDERKEVTCLSQAIVETEKS